MHACVKAFGEQRRPYGKRNGSKIRRPITLRYGRITLRYGRITLRYGRITLRYDNNLIILRSDNCQNVRILS